MRTDLTDTIRHALIGALALLMLAAAFGCTEVLASDKWPECYYNYAVNEAEVIGVIPETGQKVIRWWGGPQLLCSCLGRFKGQHEAGWNENTCKADDGETTFVD